MSMWRRRTPRILAAGLVAVGLVCSGLASATPAAASAINGQISQTEVLARAKYWVDKNVSYNQSGYFGDVNGKSYRTDCSGFVSMAWHLDTSLTTRSLHTRATQLASRDLLQPGDMLLNAGTHVVLFVGWNNAAHTAATIWHESRPGVGTVSATWPRSEVNKYAPWRYNNITGTAPTPPTDPSAQREVFESASDNAWTSLPIGSAGTSMAVTTMDDVKFLYVINGGTVFEAASNNAWRNLSTQITGASDVAAINLDGVKYVYTLINGSVYEAASNNGWRNLPTGISGASAIAATTANGVKYVYTLIGGRVHEAASNNAWRNLAMESTGTSIAVTTMDNVKYLYVVNGGTVFEAASNNGWRNLSTGITGVSDVAATNLDGVKYVYTLVGGLVHEAASNNGWRNLSSGTMGGTELAATHANGIKYFYTR